MEAKAAISNVRTPHQGRFVRCNVVTSSVWNMSDGSRRVHLEIRRDGGPYIVLEMNPEAALEIARDMLAKYDFIAGTSYAKQVP